MTNPQKQLLKLVLQAIVSVLTAMLTALGVTACR